MKKHTSGYLWKVSALGITLLALLTGCDRRYLVFNPSGPVAQKELDLIVLSAVLCAAVVIPVLVLLFYIVYRYRDKPGNKAPYTPEWNDSKILEIVWWGIPVIIICILGVYTAKTTYSLVKPPVTDVKPITIQVTSLDWKWLFQYPDQKIATVNYAEIPAGVPVQFQLTSDSMMNSFWVPELGGQEYTMPGMAMRLWLQAEKPGTYFGSGANFTGKGFAHMKFKVVAKPQAEFNQWAQQIKKSAPALTQERYDLLTKKGLAEKQSFSSYPESLFHETIDRNGGKYMKPEMKHGGHDMSMMDHDK
ncbi:cytochrome ubiquinol oxidase subunit II [Fictibacillus sp. WQ 8-8]|uniref:ubiquinol oxidase subunit II n=1 Tax=Fictibacillus sp. WQ 8-8 TaxID=2938788 RepID=UPI00210DAFDC|nr:cytochrome c oxidase subunit II transmembrane domain-containing protein [Fictibacillus sp. WQ 8-8]MCQ6264349.1 cytochrome ubiquinol oxidase subunit II [Fictibacillus sp. WQ 8-8]